MFLEDVLDVAVTGEFDRGHGEWLSGLVRENLGQCLPERPVSAGAQLQYASEPIT